ncbi:hypothetical protein KKI24_27705 [bacterium]|nr:hypothetical protein [bacterium]
MIIPLAALLSHGIYLYDKVKIPVSQDEMITFWLGAVIYVMVLSWCFLSNPMKFDLFWRFMFSAGLAILAHRIGVMDNETGGSTYFKAFSFFCIGIMEIFTVTGKTKNELKEIWHGHWQKRRHSNLGYIPPAASDSDGPFVS